MSWKFEKVFEATPTTAPKEVVQDGRYLWVTGTNKVYVYEYAGQSSGHEPGIDKYDDLNFHELDGKLRLVKTIDVPEGSAWIAKSFRNIWVANAYQFTKITQIRISTMEIATVITCPKTMNSNLVFENDRLWMVDKALEEQTGVDRQRLYQLVLSNFTWGSTEIPVRKTLARTYITPGYNGFLYVTNFNNVSLCKFTTVGGYVGQIRTNAFPQVAMSTSDRDVFISSYGGMLTRVNGLTDEVFNAYSTVETATSLSGQGSNFVWYTDPANLVGRVNRSDNSLTFTNDGDNEDWHIDISSLSDKSFTKLLVTLPFTYKQFDGSQWNNVEVKPYLIILGASKVMAIRLDPALVRENYIQISGQGMISTGSEDYMGEVG